MENVITKQDYQWMKKLSPRRNKYIDRFIIEEAKSLFEGKEKLCNFCDNKAIRRAKDMVGYTYRCKNHLKVGSMVGGGMLTYIKSNPSKGKEFNYDVLNFIPRNQ